MGRHGWMLVLAGMLAGCAAGAPGGAAGLRDGDGAASEMDAGALDGARPDGGIDAAFDAAPDAAVDAGADAVVDRGLDQGGEPAQDAGPPPEPARHVALGEARLGEEIVLTVPAGARSVLVQAQGRPDGIYAIVSVDGPDGPRNDGLGRGVWRASPSPEVATALWPVSDDPAAGLTPGEYRFGVIAAAPSDERVTVEAYLGFGAVGLTVNAFLPPALGVGVDDPAVVQFGLALEQKLGSLLDLPVEVIPALLAEGAPVDLVIDSAVSDYAALSTLAAAAPAAGPGLDVYLMGQVLDAGDRQSGLAGGLPAPVGLRGSRAAVTAIRTPLLADFPIAVADLATHELGHALGLYHTTEPFGDRFDPLGDTPECPIDCDRDGDGVLLASECGRNGTRSPPCQGAADNLMFWTLGGQRAHTAGQRRVARGHPVLSP